MFKVIKHSLKRTRYIFPCFLCLSIDAQAQLDAERILQLEQERRAEELRQLEQQQRNRSSFQTESENVLPQSADLSICKEIKLIKLLGISVFSQAEFNLVTEAFVGRCLNVNDLNELLREVNAVYFDAGYVTSRAYLGPQNLGAGELIIQIVEGQLDGIERKLPVMINQSLWPIFPNAKDSILNLRDLEQGLEQVNRLDSRNATMELLPGDEVGDSRVVVDEQKSKKPWKIRLQTNNSGQESTGEMQQQIFFAMDNLANLYDYTYVSLQSDTEPDSEGKRSRSASFHWDMPIGYWIISTDLSYFDYLSTVNGNTSLFETSGLSRSQQVSVERIIKRSQRSKSKVELSLKRKTTRNYLEDTLLQTSSRALSVAEISLEHEQFLSSGGLLVSKLGYQRGLRLWGSLIDSELLDQDSPKAQFDKYTFSLDFEKSLLLAGVNLNYQSRLVSQYSPDALFGSEVISIGSIYTVRGYKENSLASNRGVYWRNALSWHWQPEKQSSWLNRVTPSLAFDVGTVHDSTPEANKYPSLKGAAIGLSAAGKYWLLNMTYARPLNPPDYFLNTGEQMEFAVTLMF